MIPIFVVNLERDKAKKDNVSKLLGKYGIDFKFISAVDGSILDDDFKKSVYDEIETKKNIGRKMSNGEIGCALSHYNIYKSMVDNNIEKAIILEDDIFIDDEFKKFLNTANLMPDEIDLILLGYHANQHTEQKSHSSYWGRMNINEIKLVKLVEKAYGTYGYYITKNGAMKLFNLMESEKISRPIDHYTGKLNVLNTYATSDRLVYFGKESKEDSTIEANRQQQIYHSKIDQLKSVLRKYILFRIVRDTFHEVRFFLKAINPWGIK